MCTTPMPLRRILDGAAGERAPRRRRGQEAERRPGVHRDGAVAQRREGLLEPAAQRGERVRVDEDVRAEGAGECLVGVRDGGVDELLPEPRELHDAQHGREVLRALERRRILTRGDVDEQARPRAHRRIRVVRARGIQLRRRVRVPPGPLRRALVRGSQLAEELLALRPVGAHQHDLPRDAVVAVVLQPHRRDVLGLVAQVGARPRAGDDDDRGHPAELRRDRHRQVRHDGAEGRLRAGDVDVVDERMPGEVRADVAAAAHDPEEAGLDQRRERPLEHRDDGILRRVDLQQRDAVEREELVQDVEERDGGDVAGAEHEAHPARCRGGPLTEARRGAGARVRDARREPHLGRESGQQHPVRRRQGRGVHGDASARGRRGAHRGERALPVGEQRERVGVRVQCDERRVRTGQPLLAAQRMPRLEPLRGGRDVGPLLRDGRDGGTDAAEKRPPLAQRQEAPRARARAQVVQGGVEARALVGIEIGGRGHGILLGQPFGLSISIRPRGTASQIRRDSMSARRSR